MNVGCIGSKRKITIVLIFNIKHNITYNIKYNFTVMFKI